jgi:hypothetical protein
MGGNRSRRADGGKARAEELHRLAAACRAFARDFERARADVSSGDFGRVLVRGIDIARDFRRAGLDCDLDLGPELTRKLESGHVPTTDALAENPARRLDKAMSTCWAEVTRQKRGSWPAWQAGCCPLASDGGSWPSSWATWGPVRISAKASTESG